MALLAVCLATSRLQLCAAAAVQYRYAMWHIGNGTARPGPVLNCSLNGSRIPPGDSKSPRSAQHTSSLSGSSSIYTATDSWSSNSISVSVSPDGPWTLLRDNTLPACNNPAPWVHRNGTLYSLCDDIIYRADAITGPWARVTSIWNANSSRERPRDWHYEDPCLFATSRGWHILFHAGVRDNSTGAGNDCTESNVAAHMFSSDGYRWHASPIPPYGTQVELAFPQGVQRGGYGLDSAVPTDVAHSRSRTITVATRERPKLIFNAAGEATHLVNGVCGVGSCTDSPKTGCMDCKYKHWDFTLIQPLIGASVMDESL